MYAEAPTSGLSVPVISLLGLLAALAWVVLL